MRRPWSISTTVRNPERLRAFLRVLKKLEGEPFNKENQIKYQELLIQERLYTPTSLPPKYRSYYENPSKDMPFEIAEEIFMLKKYKDPAMRGRQSVNPLNKLGFAIARETSGPVKITTLGNLFLNSDYDIGEIFFKSLLKLQFPNPWSKSFSRKDGFNIMPFIATLKLLAKIDAVEQKKGLSKREFSVFVPLLINAMQIDEYANKIIEFRGIDKQEKDAYVYNFVKSFYKTNDVTEKIIKDLFDYGDNTMRYFRLTRYFRIETDAIGRYWRIDLEPTRYGEIKQLIDTYDGRAIEFKSQEEYISYLSDINRPELPWEQEENLKKVFFSLKTALNNFITQRNVKITPEEKLLLEKDATSLSKSDLKKYIEEMRRLNTKISLSLQKSSLKHNIEVAKRIIEILEKPQHNLKKIPPEQFEKLIADALKVINDEILIKPNYPIDDYGEPISHAPGGKADIEYFYKHFVGICEVTLDCSNKQWIQEGQPVMRHLRDFENKNRGNPDTFCVFIAPKVREDTYSIFWTSVKYEYDGKTQKIIPLTTKQFAAILKKLVKYLENGRTFSHQDLYELYNKLVDKTKHLQGFSQWVSSISETINEWENL